MTEVNVLILAAGKGSRMKSDLPKVLHPVAEKPMLGHVLDTASAFNNVANVVVGHGASLVEEAFADSEINWHLQDQQLGTGHAVKCGTSELEQSLPTLILYGDVPCIPKEELQSLIDIYDGGLALMTTKLDNPTGYGRVIRESSGQVVRIIEEKDADDAEKAVDEINTGIMVVNTHRLNEWLAALSNNNAQGEYYLTDIVEMAVHEKRSVVAHCVADADCVTGVNDRIQQAEMEAYMRAKRVRELMVQGCTVRDPMRLDIRGSVTVGRDVQIDVNVVLNGDVVLGDGVVIGPNCMITDSVISEGTTIEANSIIDASHVGKQAAIGPFARIRPGTQLSDETKVGNFVETKNASVGKGSKINHLSYVGDAELGERVNVGAGTITCNYDGARKHKTTLGNDVFIGSNTSLVAPVTLGDKATTGAGSTISADVDADTLAVTRAKVRTVKDWPRPKK